MAHFEKAVTTDFCGVKLKQVVTVTQAEQPAVLDVPDDYRVGALFTQWLVHNSLWSSLTETCRVARKAGGHTLGSIVFFFLLYFSAQGQSIKKHADKLGRIKALASLVGLARLPSQAAVSRFLKGVCWQSVDDFRGWFLEVLHDSELARHPATTARDSRGGAWHVFDYDPVAFAMRQRKLVECEERPEASRSAANVGEPGYAGRKRGEVMFRRGMLQHAGSSLWLGAWFAKGGGDGRWMFSKAVAAIVAFCKAVGLDIERAIVRVDGEGGNVPFISLAQENSLRYLVRLSHYGLLEQPDIEELLRGAGEYAPGPSAGPRREALDLGTIRLVPSPKTLQDDGTTYEPVDSRVFVTRYPADEKHGAGYLKGGFLYEMFATSLDPADWPAAELVNPYYGRAGGENYFARSNAELNLNRIFSYELPGQALVTLIGLLFWNLELLLSFQLKKKEIEEEGLPSQTARCIEQASRPDKAPYKEEAICSAPVHPAQEVIATSTAQSFDETLTRLVHTFDLGPGWTSNEDGTLRCPNGQRLAFKGIRIENDQARIIYQAILACDICPDRNQCAPKSYQPALKKERTFVVSLEEGQELDALHRGARRTEAIVAQRKPAHTHSHLLRPPAPTSPAPLAASAPTLLCTKLRHIFRALVAETSIHIKIQSHPTPAVRQWTSIDRAHKSRLRKTWSERHRYHALPPQSRVSISVLLNQESCELMAVMSMKTA